MEEKTILGFREATIKEETKETASAAIAEK